MNTINQGMLFGLLAMTGGGAAGVLGAQFAPGRPEAIKEYILAHPEIIPEAMQKLEARATGQAVAMHRKQIETPYAAAWEGAKDADVTLVQFFDYNCGYCRAALPDIDRLLKEDKKLRVVYREFPILGPASEGAARVSLAAAKAGKYPAFHRAVYAAGRPDPATIARIADQMGIPREGATDPAVQTELDSNFSLAKPLGLTGTPSWVIGDQVLSGAVGYDALKAAIAAARKG